MIPSSMVCCHVEDLSLWTSNTQDINRVTVVPIQRRNFVIMLRRNQDMAAIDCSSDRWKSRDFVEVLREGFWLVWPSNEFISEAINCICNTSDDSTYGMRTWSVDISDCVVESICSNKL